jgi:MoaA/NifB/PqqE/SkfB family radical SAM enzyme
MGKMVSALATWLWRKAKSIDSFLAERGWHRSRRLGRSVWRKVRYGVIGGHSGIGLRARKDSEGAHAELKGRFCPNPFRQLDVYENGETYLCCSSWLPTPAGNLHRQRLEEVWNSEKAQSVRAGILDGSFRHCNHGVCPAIQEDSLPTLEQARRDPALRDIIDHQRTRMPELPLFINLCNDASCNLWCPSCRTHRINHTDGDTLAQLRALQNEIKRAMFARPSARYFHVNVTGSGDPFASRIFREFLFELNGGDFPNLRINLQTNGVLLTPKNWRRMQRIHKNIDTVLVSFDAARPETYAITRRGGHWPTLLDNVRALGEFRRREELGHLRLDFVVQQANYREMPAFVRLAESLGADCASFSKILDWGTWSRAVFEVQCIWREDHPEYEQFLKVMRDPALGRPSVALGNLAPYREVALDGNTPRIAALG